MQQQEYVFYPSRVKMIFLALLLLLFGGIGLFLITIANEALGVLIGIILFILFGVLAIYPLVRVFRYEPSLIITDNYLYDGGNIVSVGKLHWEEIEEIFIYRVGAQKFLGIQVTNPEEIMARVSKVKRMIINLNKGFPIVNIAQMNVSVPLEEVFEIIVQKSNNSISRGDQIGD